MKIALIGAITAALVVGAVPGSSQNVYDVPSLFVSRVDPRLCPSPACGGYWVSEANHARTTCVDLRSSPRCYVARGVDRAHADLGGGIPDGAVVLGHLEPWGYDGFSEALGAIIVDDVRTPVGSFEKGTYFRVRDLGIRCVRAPCLSYRATVLNGVRRVLISTLDLSAVRASPEELRQAQAALTTPGGLFVLGRIVATPDGGRALRSTRIFLKAPKPRA